MSQHFYYKAVDAHGRTIQGHIDANNENDLHSRLDRMGLDLIYFEAKNKHHRKKGRVTRLELISFCFHMEQLTRSGVPLISGLMDLRDSLPQSVFRDVVANLIESIEGGEQLSEAMQHFPDIFDQVFVSLINAGEASGQLSKVFNHLTTSLKWEDEMAARTRKMLMYPSFVAAVVIATLFFLMIYLVPQLIAFIKNVGGELPLHTKILLHISDAFVGYWYLIIGIPVVLVFTLITLIKVNPQVAFTADRLKLRLWIIGPILEKIILARFSNFFALLYSSGITVLESLAICKNLMGNRLLAEALQQVHDSIADGVGISESFERVKLFPPLVLRMVRVGESTGQLDTSLLNVSYFYEREAKESIERMQTLIEPSLTVIMGGMLMWVMLSVLGPIYDKISQIAGPGMGI
jgi:type IV pilus assembly protein PilC